MRVGFANHLPSKFPIPSIGTLLALQAPMLVYLAAPCLLGTTQSAAETHKNRANQLLAAKIMALAIGVHFSFALGVSGMMRPSKVLGFLALSPTLITAGAWDPSLAMVAIGGIIPASIAYFHQIKPKQDQLRRSSAQTTSKKAEKSDSHLRPELSLVSPEFRTPADPSKIDARLVIGSIFFGLGWGATGFVSSAIHSHQQAPVPSKTCSLTKTRPPSLIPSSTIVPRTCAGLAIIGRVRSRGPWKLVQCFRVVDLRCIDGSWWSDCQPTLISRCRDMRLR